MLYNKENYKLLKRTFNEIEIVTDKNDERQTEPTRIRQETVHIAETIGEIQPPIQAEHKGLAPETVRKIVFSGSIGKYWILKIPYQKELTPRLLGI